MADIELTTADDATLAAIRAALGAPAAARSLRFPDAEGSPPSPVLPDVATREGKVLGFAAGGGIDVYEPGETEPPPPDWIALANGMTGVVSIYDMDDLVESGGVVSQMVDTKGAFSPTHSASGSTYPAGTKVNSCLSLNGAQCFRPNTSDFTGNLTRFHVFIVWQQMLRSAMVTAFGSPAAQRLLGGNANGSNNRPSLSISPNYQNASFFTVEFGNGNDLDSGTFNSLRAVLPIGQRLMTTDWRVEGSTTSVNTLHHDGVDCGNYDSGNYSSFEQRLSLTLGLPRHTPGSSPASQGFRVRAMIVCNSSFSTVDAAALRDALMANFSTVDAYA